MKLESEKIVRQREPVCRVLPALVAMHYDYWELIPPARTFKGSELAKRASVIYQKLICLVHENDL